MLFLTPSCCLLFNIEKEFEESETQELSITQHKTQPELYLDETRVDAKAKLGIP